MDCEKEDSKILRLSLGLFTKNLGTALGSEIFLFTVRELQLP